MEKFLIKKTPKGEFTFFLMASNGEKIIVASETYTTKAMAKNGIKSVIKFSEKCSKEERIKDLTAKTVEEVKSPRFEIYKDKKGSFRYRLLASNGENIAICEKGYTSKANCIKGCHSVFKASSTAEIEDLKK